MSKRTGGDRGAASPSPEQLPEAELEVLACLLRQGPATAAQIRQSLASFRPLTHGSVLTLLKRLSERGLVTREKSGQGKAFAYRPTRRSSPSFRKVLKRLMERVFGGDPVALVAALLESSPPNPEEVLQIRKMLDELQNREAK
jgi:predicted transcriptional regulator